MTAPLCLCCRTRPAASGRRHCQECAGTSRRATTTTTVVVHDPSPPRTSRSARRCATCEEGQVPGRSLHQQCAGCRKAAVRRDGSRLCRRCGERRPAAAFPPMLYRGTVRPGTLCDTCVRARGGHRTDGMPIASQTRYRADAAVAALAARGVLAPCDDLVGVYGSLRVVVVARAPCGDVRVEVRDTHGRRHLERRGRDAYSSVAAAVAYAQATGARLA